jgi:lipopolysaccharide transport system permease protein
VIATPLDEVYRCRVALASTLADEVKRKHAGSVFGLGWFVIMPLLFLGFYAAVYLVIFKVKPAEMSAVAYLHFIYIGLMAYLGFTEAMTAGAGALVVNRSIILNTVFPAELLPLRTVISTQTTFVLGLTLAVVWSIFTGRGSAWLLLVPLVMALQIVYLIGLAWFLSPIFIVFRDLGQLLSFISLAILVISPIAYRASELTGYQSILLYINPLYYYLSAYQAIIFEAKAPPLVQLVLGAVASVVMFFAGFWFFRRVKAVVAEHV